MDITNYQQWSNDAFPIPVYETREEAAAAVETTANRIIETARGLGTHAVFATISALYREQGVKEPVAVGQTVTMGRRDAVMSLAYRSPKLAAETILQMARVNEAENE